MKNNIPKINNAADYAQKNRNFWYFFYYEFFRNLITNFYEWDNLPDSIDELWLEKALNYNGFVGFYYHQDFGIVASKGAFGGFLDIYDNPTTFKPVNNALIKYPKSIPINWYTDMLDPKKAVIVGNNNYYSNSFGWIDGFCLKLADIETSIQLNRNAQNRPFVAITDNDSKFSLKNMWNKIMNGDPVIYVNKQKTATGALSAVQLEDLIHILDTKSDFLLDKLHDEKQRVINQLLTTIGINNNAVDKAERLVKAEATANNGLINACIRVTLSARQKGVKRVNDVWGPNGVDPIFDEDIVVRQSPQIEEFNTERVLADIDRGIGDLGKEGLDGGDI